MISLLSQYADDFGYYYGSDYAAYNSGLAGLFLAMILAVIIAVVVIYIITSLSLYKIAQRTNTKDAFLAWIPIANLYLLTQIALRPAWWIVLMLIPIVNIVFGILIWMDISKRMGKPDWWGVIIGIVPVVDFIFMLMLAFGDYKLTKIPDRRKG